MNGSPFAFTDVEQAQSPTCSFAAALAAVAETNFVSTSNITTVSQLPGNNNYVFAVKLYQPNPQGVYQPVWVDVPYDGTIYPTDLQSTDPAQFWPTLFQRAYQQIAPPSDATSFDVGHAFQTLTGASNQTFSVSGASTDVADTIDGDLMNGQPMVASSRSNGTVTVDSSGVIQDSGPIMLDSSGVIHDHAYTVLGIDYTSSGPFVTLRNPWAQDTDWTHYDTNHDGVLSVSEVAAMRAGLDGNDDGIIRIPWATFTSDFTACTVSNITGHSIDQPLSPIKPTFVQSSIGPQTVTAGSTLSLNLSALSPDGKTISYYLPQNTLSQVFPNPGSVDIHSGQYTWAPTDAQVGVYNVTVVAQESPVELASLTFQVTVLPVKPSIGSFTSDRPAISSSNGQITLTASNVTNLNSTGSVLFYRDTDHNGVFDSSDTLLASLPYNASGTYTLSPSAIPNLTPGTNETFFAVAQNGSGATTATDTVGLTVQVIVGASLPPLVAPLGTDTLASSAVTGSQAYDLVAYDGKGNSAVFWADAQSQQGYMLRLDPSGTAMGAPISLNLVQGRLDDVAMLPDGHFVIAWNNLSNQLYAMEFNADGTPYTGDFSQTGYEIDATPDGTARVAIAAPGTFAIVEPRNVSGSPAYYYLYANGGFEQGSGQLLDSGQAILYVSVAMDDHGAAIVGWIESQSNQVMAQKFDQYGTPVGSPVAVNAIANSADSSAGLSVAADEQGRYVFTWMEKSGTADNIMARRFLADGTAVDATEFQVNDSTTSALAWPRVAFQHNRIVVAWATSGQPNNDVFAQAYSWDNTLRKLGGNFAVPSTNTSMQVFPAVAVDSTGTNFTIAWERFTGPNSTYDSVFKRFNGLNLTPLGFALNAIAPEPTSLLTIPAFPTANLPLGVFADPGAGNWTFALVSGAGSTDNASFQIINGLLSMTPAGVTSGLKAHYSIRVRATPDAGVPVEQVFNFSGGLSGDVNFGQLVPSLDYVHAAVMQPNGQFVVAGVYGSGFARTALARYNPDGTLDPSFGGKGQVVTNALDGFNYATGVAVEPNGQIVVAGWGYDPVAVNDTIFLVRYNTDGTLDTSFGNGGIVTGFMSGSQVENPVAAVQNDGMIVIAANDLTNKQVVVARYTVNGTLDPNFGSGGIATLTAIGTSDQVSALAIQPDGKIVVAGTDVNGGFAHPFVARFLSSGSPDLSFNTVGYSSVDSLSGNNHAYALALQADGKFLLGGSFGLLRLSASGALDTTFNGTGVVTTSSGTTTVVPITAVAVEPDGKILAVGSASNGTNYDFVFLRYTTTGALDFGQTRDLGGNDYAEALGLSPSGQIDIAGDTTINSGKADDFGFWQIPLPVVTGVTPSQGLIGNSTAVTITGYNFTGVSSVAFGSTSAAFTVVSPTQITATAPTGSGSVDVTVTGANGTSITTPIDLFTYQVQTTLQTPVASPSPVHPGDKLTLSVGITASTKATVNLGTVTFRLVNPITGVTVASDAGVAVSGGTATDVSFSLPATTVPGLYNLVATYSDNGGAFAGTSLTASNAVSVIPVPAVVADFTGNGVWRYTSGGWQQLSHFDAQSVVAAADGSVVANYGGSGIWRWTTAGWQQLSVFAPQSIVVDGSGDIVANYGGAGLWRWAVTGGWSEISTFTPLSVVVNPGGDVVANYGGSGVWRWTLTGGWQQLSGFRPQSIAVDSAGDVVANYGGSGLWRWAVAGGWTELSSFTPQSVLVDAAGDVAANYGGSGVWRWTLAGGWQQLSAFAPQSIAGDSSGDVVANYGGSGVWRWTLGGGWQQLSGFDPQSIAVDWSGDVVANYGANGLWLWKLLGGWQELTPANAYVFATYDA